MERMFWCVVGIEFYKQASGFKREKDRKGVNGMTPEQIKILRYMKLGEKYPCHFTPKNIGEACSQTPERNRSAWAVKKLNVLVAKGLVRRREIRLYDPSRVTSVVYSITPAGKTELDNIGL